MWTPIDGRGMTIAEHFAHVQHITPFDGCSGMTLHNTGAPNLSQAKASEAQQRIKNYELYYRDEQGWPSGPHAFVYDDLIWLFTPYNHRGTHSPSWNGTKFGIEMTGDYGVDDPLTGRGANVVKNAVALFAHWHTKMGWNPESIKLHKEDPKTTHDCPGKKINKQAFIGMVEEYMGHAGELKHVVVPTNPVVPKGAPGRTKTPGDTLNMRDRSSLSSIIVKVVPNNSSVRVLSSAANGDTIWFRIEYEGVIGWVHASYVELM